MKSVNLLELPSDLNRRVIASVFLLPILMASGLRDATVAGVGSQESMVYVVDGSDLVGPATSGISAQSGAGMACVNRFSVLGGYTMITDVTLQWSLMLGNTNFTAGIWSDPDQDGNPADAVLLATSALSLAEAGKYLQQVYFPSPQYIGPEGTSFFVGVFWQEFSQ